MSKLYRYASIMLVGAFLVGCEDPSSPKATPAGAAQSVATQPETPETTDAFLLSMSERISTLSGLWIDRSGNLNVALTRATDSGSARVAIREVRRLQKFQTRELVFRTASYTFQQLHAWRDQIIDLVNEVGVEYLDADERRGKVVVGINSRASSAAILAKIPDSIPAGAVELRAIEPVRTLQTLQDSLRPVRGGARVTWIRNGGQIGGQCTLGFNVHMPDTEDWFAVTNSHCGDMGAFNSGSPTLLHNPLDWSASWPSQIGTEIADPSFVSGGYGCPSGRYCRNSDAALYEYTSNSHSGGYTFFRTIEIGGLSPASITIHSTTPTIGAVDDDELTTFLSGQVVDKVGQTTGWTRGEIGVTDATIGLDTNFPGQNKTLLHQYYVEACSLGGDSGSPVFEYYGSPGSGLIYGILWGGGGTPGSTCYYVFSVFSLMRAELGIGLAGT